MNTENIPQVGSKWQQGYVISTVSNVRRKGRGHTVHFSFKNEVNGVEGVSRLPLASFLKAAKPL